MPASRRTNVRDRTPEKQPEKPAEKQPTEYGEREDGSLSGNLTRDPELRFTISGRSVAVMGVAVNERVQIAPGEWEDADPEFWDVTAWGQQAENCAEYLKKGDRIVAVGYFQDQTYTNRDGERVTRTTFTAKDIGPSMLWNGAKVIKAERSGK
jgi:single-strand DNA-binding protein